MQFIIHVQPFLYYNWVISCTYVRTVICYHKRALSLKKYFWLLDVPRQHESARYIYLGEKNLNVFSSLCFSIFKISKCHMGILRFKTLKSKHCKSEWPHFVLFHTFLQVVTIVALMLSGANLYGYIRCKVGSKKQLSTIATQFLGQQMMSRVCV